MATAYLTPGVYVEEVSGGSKPIEGVGTSVAAFVGFAEKGPFNEATLITSWNQFIETFGRPVMGAFLAHSVYGYFNNGGGVCYVVNLNQASPPAARKSIPTKSGTPLLQATALQAAPDDIMVEISSVSTVSAASTKETARPGKDNPKAAATGAPEGEQAAAPETSSAPEPGGEYTHFTLSIRNGSKREVYQDVTLRRGDRKFVETVVRPSELVRLQLDPAGGEIVATAAPREGRYVLEKPLLQLAETSASQARPAEYVGDPSERSGLGGLDAIDDVTIVCVPDLMSAYQREWIDEPGIRKVQTAILDHCERMGNRVAILDAPPDIVKPQAIRDWRMQTAGYDSSYATLYYPWIKVDDPTTGKTISVPPSGHVAGVWARVDDTRGVHKAPANETIRGCIGVDYQVTAEEQSILNPNGVNCIRAFPGRGIRIWGARTLSSDPEWRYLNVRRLFNFVRESIKLGTQWAVFEPNNIELWMQLRRDLTAFLTRIYMTGAFFGATAQDAFFVKCDSQTNPPAVIDAGQVIIEIGIAPTKPAEFVIFRISQYAPGAEVA